MARPTRKPDPPVAETLFAEPYQFDFFQAVRLLARLDPGRGAVGVEGLPRRERVRFRAIPSLSFPPSSIRELTRPDDPAEPPVMSVAFLGLYGPSGVLPRVYTELIMERLRAGDRTMAAFLDLFNHRMISFFYRAWEKYRPAIARERGEQDDRFADALFALMGLGLAALRGRHEFPDSALLPAAGFFAQRRRPAVVLEAFLSDYFRYPVAIESFVGRWLRLEPEDLSRLEDPRLGGNNQLGVSMVVGARVWDEPSKFRVRVGPIDLAQFRGLLPGTGAFAQLCGLTRQFVDAEFDFDVRLVLKAEAIPACRLDSASDDGPRLGRTAWLTTRPMTRDAEDAVFAVDGSSPEGRPAGARRP